MAIVNSDVCRVQPEGLVDFEDGIARLSKAALEIGYERPWTAYQTVHGRIGTIAFDVTNGFVDRRGSKPHGCKQHESGGHGPSLRNVAIETPMER